MIKEIQVKLSKVDSWDIWYLNMARYIATKSKDPSTKTGAVIVRPNKSLVSIGFNGFPAALLDKPEYLSDREKKYSRTVHCEENALIFSYENLQGYTLYTWPFASCDRCCVAQIQAGIKRFVFPEMPPEKAERWGSILQTSKDYMQEAGCEVVEVPLKMIPDVVLQ